MLDDFALFLLVFIDRNNKIHYRSNVTYWGWLHDASSSKHFIIRPGDEFLIIDSTIGTRDRDASNQKITTWFSDK